MSRQKVKDRRQILLNEHPFCCYCGVKVVYFKIKRFQRTPDNFATVEHLRSKYQESRKEPNLGNEQRIVLACNKCNNEKGSTETSLLSKEELWERSKRHPYKYK